MLTLRELLGLLGIEPERLQMSFISAAEGKKCAEVAAEITELIKKLGPLELEDGDKRDR
jgi:F420-non-reducing hydrogenase iron-sulfur subunit